MKNDFVGLAVFLFLLVSLSSFGAVTCDFQTLTVGGGNSQSLNVEADSVISLTPGGSVQSSSQITADPILAVADESANRPAMWMLY